MKCDELKAYIAPTPDGTGLADYYLKSEADKVIAEKEAAIAELKEQVHDYAQGLYVMQARTEIELRHQKYKRCLAMYRYCAIKALYELDLKGNDVEWKWYSKWMHYWFDLAEEPTWAKFLQLIHKETK